VRPRRLDRDDPSAERPQAHVAEVRERQPPTAEDEPDDVADRRSGALVLPRDDRAAERPEVVDADPERGDAERDRDDEDNAISVAIM
jgi:hypothetical protein